MTQPSLLANSIMGSRTDVCFTSRQQDLDREQFVMKFPSSSGSAPSTLIELLESRARTFGDKLAFRYVPDGEGKTVEVSYRELRRRACEIAAHLQATCGRDERVLLIYPPGIDYVCAFFGCVYSGNLPVPVVPPRPNRRSSAIAAICGSAAPAAVLTDASLERRLSDTSHGMECLGRLPRTVTDHLDGVTENDWKAPDRSASDIAFLQYTSGSTGNPKGVMVSHGNLIHNLRAIQRAFASTPDDHGVCWLPLYHDMGLIGTILAAAYSGASNTLLSPATAIRNPLRWLQMIGEERATVSGGPDFAFHWCCKRISEEDKQTLDLSSWRLAFSGAEPVRAETLRRFSEAFAPCGFRGESFLACYGLAESTLLVASGDVAARPTERRCVSSELAARRYVEATVEENDSRTLVGCGKPAENQKIVIVDPKTRRPCPAGVVGEIWVAGPSVAQGYFRAAEATESTFRATLAETGEGPFLRTGDLGLFLDGELYVTGRLKEMIILCGRNYYPQDIEWSVQQSHEELRAHAGAAFAAELDGAEVLVVANELEGRRRDIDFDDIITAIRHAVIDQHEIEPHAVALLRPGAIPRTSSGKIRRSACRDAFLSESLKTAATWSLPASVANGGGGLDEAALRQDITRAWTEVLRVGDVKSDQKFFELGGDSLQAMMLLNRLQARLGESISETALFDVQTVDDWAEYLRRHHSEALRRTYADEPGAGNGHANGNGHTNGHTNGNGNGRSKGNGHSGGNDAGRMFGNGSAHDAAARGNGRAAGNGVVPGNGRHVAAGHDNGHHVSTNHAGIARLHREDPQKLLASLDDLDDDQVELLLRQMTSEGGTNE